MLERLRAPSPALLIACLALFVALGGIGYAAVKIDGKDIKNKSIAGKKLKDRTIAAAKVKRDTLTGAQIDEARLGAVPTARRAARADAADVATVAGRADRADRADRATIADSATALAGRMTVAKQVAPTNHDDQPTAQATAPKVVLLKAGTVTVYAKCWSSGGGIWSAAYVETSADGALVTTETGTAFFYGHPYLDVATPESDRKLQEISTGGNAAMSTTPDSSSFYAASPDGTAIRGDVYLGVKIGSPAGGDGPYGPGASCRFAGIADRLS